MSGGGTLPTMASTAPTEASPAGRVLVYGTGRSGLAAAQLLASREIPFVLHDDRSTERPGDAPAKAALLGQEAETALAEEPFLFVVASPGIPPTAPGLSLLEARGIPIISEVELAYRHTSRPVIAVTGTNGKSTAVTLIAETLRASGVSCTVSSNIGYPFSRSVLEDDEVGYHVVEVSSYQLHYCDRFRPRIAVLTNLAPNHDGWHGGRDAYYADKLRIFGRQNEGDVAIHPADEPRTEEVLAGRPVRQIKMGPPRPRDGDSGQVHVYWDPDHRAVRSSPGGETLLETSDLQGCASGLDPGSFAGGLVAAAALARAMDLPRSALEGALRRFEPLPFRMQPVACVDGVSWVNDSKSTNVDSTLYALDHTSAPIVLLLGGRDKGLQFERLGPATPRSRVRAVVVYGEARQIIGDSLAVSGSGSGEPRPPVERVETLDEAVFRARRLAVPGDTVLFSPACPSFDQFQDFEHRGRHFNELVAASRLGGAEAEWKLDGEAA